VPELPEVEVTRRRIAPVLIGRTIARVKTTAQSYFFLTPPSRLRRALLGRSVLALARHGKYLIASLDDGRELLLHLGMTGQLFTSTVYSPRLLSATQRGALTPGEQQRFRPDAHTHLQLGFGDSGPELYFRDVRKFGKVRLLDRDTVDPRLARLGVDALAAKAEHLFASARGRRVPIKTLLLDQSVLAGVGNIYADEALFLASIRPTRAAHRVSRVECQRLLSALKRVLRRSIETGGSSINDFVGPDGQDGHYQDERWVYARHTQACKRCKTLIERIVLGQRSAHFCRTCQK